MKLAVLLIFYASSFFKFTESVTCVDTTGLTITVKDETVTTIYTDEVTLSAYVNYPKDNVYVSYKPAMAQSPTLINSPSSEDLCRYDARFSSSNYDINGLNFTVTFSATALSDTVSDVTILHVQVAAEIPTTSHSTCVLSGENTKLVCEANGNPIPSISWSNSDIGTVSTVIKQPDYPDTFSATANLSLTNITFQDQGDYTCTVKNAIGSPPLDFTDFKTITLDVNIAPVLVSSTSHVKVDYGSVASLSCMFQAYPLPDTTWSNDTSEGYKIEIQDSGEYYRKTTLEIQSVTCDYVAQYSCDASNTVCSVAIQIRSENMTVNIIEPPGVDNLRAETPECDGTYVSLSWSRPNGWTDESSYHVTVNSTDPPLDLKVETVIITNLDPKTTYEFQVTVVLCNEMSSPTSVTVETADIGIPSSPINVTQRVSDDHDTCYVTWTEPTENYNKIEDYEVTYSSCQTEQNEVTDRCTEPVTGNTSNTSYQIAMDEKNSVYFVNVSARTCAGKGESATVNKIVCISNRADTEAFPLTVMVVCLVASFFLIDGGMGDISYNKKRGKKTNENRNMSANSIVNFPGFEENEFFLNNHNNKETTIFCENAGKSTAMVCSTPQ